MRVEFEHKVEGKVYQHVMIRLLHDVLVFVLLLLFTLHYKTERRRYSDGGSKARMNALLCSSLSIMLRIDGK